MDTTHNSFKYTWKYVTKFEYLNHIKPYDLYGKYINQQKKARKILK